MTEEAWFQWELLLIGGAVIVAYIALMLELEKEKNDRRDK